MRRYDARKMEMGNISPEKADTIKADMLIDLSWEQTMTGDYEAAKRNSDEAIRISEAINYKPGIGNALGVLGVIHSLKGNFPEALKSHQASLTIREETGNRKGIAASYNNIGNIHFDQGNYPEALKNYYRYLKISDDKKNIATALNNIGNVNTSQKNLSEAIENYSSSLKIRKELKNKFGIASTLANIGLVYWEQRNLDEALNNLKQSLKAFEEINDQNNIAGSLSNIAAIYLDKKNYSLALESYTKSMKISEQLGDKYSLATVYIGLGHTYTKMNEAAKGNEWLKKGLAIAKEIGGLPVIRDAYEHLAESDSALGNFKNAHENYKLFVRYRDSLLNEEATKKALQTKMQYDFDKQQVEAKAISDIEVKKQKLLRNTFIGGFAALVLFSGMIIFQHRKTRHEKKRSEQLLHNILPNEVADEIKSKGTAKAKAFTMVTVMFTDFKDFTTVSEKISAELIVDEIHTCFSAFDNIIHKHRIEKIKTIGDAYLCASGLPVSNYTHASDMINAAIEIRNFMDQRKKEKISRGEIPFELRIGIHTGPVVAGVVGVKKYAYDIWGDTVNIAARMEQNSDAGKINISGATYELVKDKFNCIHRGKIEAKNKGTIDMYFVETI